MTKKEPVQNRMMDVREKPGRVRRTVNSLGRRFFRTSTALLTSLALAGPAGVAGVAALTASREAKAQAVPVADMDRLSLSEPWLQRAIRLGQRIGQDTYGLDMHSVGAAIYLQGFVIEMAAVVDSANPEREGYGMTVTHPDGTVTSRNVLMADLRQEYREATGRELQFVCLGIDVVDSERGAYVEMYVIPISQRFGDPQAGVPVRGIGFEIDTRQHTRGGPFLLE